MTTRRAMLGGALALAGCSRGVETAAAPSGEDAETPTAFRATAQAAAPPPSLREAAPFAVGAAVVAAQLDDPPFRTLLTRQCSQVTASFEMKMEVIARPDGGLDFTRGDRIAAFARAHGQRLHGHTLIWHEEAPAYFQALDGRPGFGPAHDRYIRNVAGRWPQAVGWDVVNEPVTEEGEGLRSCLWSRNLGGEEAYIARAFHVAREAASGAVLFLNEYNLESKPRKRATFLRLAERLLRAGVPVGGLGTQTHLDLSLPPGALAAAMRELGSLGLPVHISEADCVLTGGPSDPAARLQRQARLFGEAMAAFADLPVRQRYAFTTWGLRDRDSWLRDRPGGEDAAPLLFDDAGRPKPAFGAVRGALRGRG